MPARLSPCLLAGAMLLALAGPMSAPALAAPMPAPAPAAPPQYARIPAGQFVSVLAGGKDDGPVKVAGFALRAAPVSEREFLAFLHNHPEWSKEQVPALFADGSYLRDLNPGGSARPVTNVSWYAAQAYCESEQARLPLWYEWEYVAAADATRTDARSDPRWRAAILDWYARAAAAPPANMSMKPNVYGVRAMHGLIWEWVGDFNALMISADSRNQGDPERLQFCGAGAISLQDRDNYAILMRIALLSSLGAADTTGNLGFRCARNLVMESR